MPEPAHRFLPGDLGNVKFPMRCWRFRMRDSLDLPEEACAGLGLDDVFTVILCEKADTPYFTELFILTRSGEVGWITLHEQSESWLKIDLEREIRSRSR